MKFSKEWMMEACCLGAGNERVQSKHIELVMPNNKFFLRLDLLYVVEIFNDGNTADEILEDKIDDSSPIVVDLCSTGKSKNKQLNFINIICGRKYKTNKPMHMYLQSRRVCIKTMVISNHLR